jgi:hypothetical protein
VKLVAKNAEPNIAQAICQNFRMQSSFPSCDTKFSRRPQSQHFHRSVWQGEIDVINTDAISKAVQREPKAVREPTHSGNLP